MISRKQILIYLPIILVPIGVFAPFLFTKQVLFWGTPSMQFVPWWVQGWRTVFSGELPLWNPYLGMGAPLLANYQSGFFYPPYWIYGLLYMMGGAQAIASGIGFVIVIHLIWAAIGMIKVTKLFQFPPYVQVVCALSFSLSGYIISRASFLSIVSTIAWFPWLFAYVTSIVIRRQKGDVYKLSLITGMMLLAGHAQTAWYAMVFSGIWGIFVIFLGLPTRLTFKEYVDKLLRLASGAFLGVALSAIQLIPTAEYLLQSQRSSAVDYEFAMTYSFWPWRLLGFIAPDMFGNPAFGNYWGYGNYWEDAVYIGMIPFIWGVIAIGRIFLRRRDQPDTGQSVHPGLNFLRIKIFLVVSLFVVFMLALGKNTLIFPWLYYHVPTFDMFQAPTRISYLGLFSLIILSGYALSGFRKLQGRALYWARLATMGAFAITAGAMLGWFLLKDIEVTFIRATAIAGVWALLAGGVALLAPDNEAHREKWGVLVVMVLSIDLVFAGFNLNPGIDKDFYAVKSNLPPMDAILDGGRLYLPTDIEDEIKYHAFFLFDTFTPKYSWDELHKTYLPNINLLYEIPVANNYDPLQIGLYKTWIDRLGEMDSETQLKWLYLMNVAAIEEVSFTDTLNVKFNPLPAQAGQVSLIPCAVKVKSEDEWFSNLSSLEYNPDHKIFVWRLPDALVGCSSGDGLNRILSVDETPNSLQVSLDLSEPQWLFVSQTWYPGWRVYLDSEQVPLYRANYLFKAVYVPAGKHDIEIVYRPASLLLGAVITFVAVLLLCYGFLKPVLQTRKFFRNI